jgi:predicted enzyme related to lactoylglutathione lyase
VIVYNSLMPENAPVPQRMSESNPNEASTTELNLVVIQASDLEASKAFYECFGLIFGREQHGRGPEHYASEVGNVIFEIYPLRGGSPANPIRIGFQVPSLDQAIAALQHQSAKILSQPQDSPWGRRAVVEDPDGNRVELTERA